MMVDIREGVVVRGKGLARVEMAREHRWWDGLQFNMPSDGT
ncbi:MAG: hypothetical protein O2931_11630 [Planctomycetota bacterium]|nr:hypothetical protein [Planctomycetota bacterium]MDA1179436.1 hypothetical protein [Planctomycetota bacterium]